MFAGEQIEEVISSSQKLKKGDTSMAKEFNPRIEVFDPFVVPFSSEKELVFDERDLDACCACTACSACSACK